MRLLPLLTLLLLSASCAAQVRVAGQVLDPDGNPVRPDQVFAVVDVPDEDGPSGETRAALVGLRVPDREGRFDYTLEGSNPRLSFRKAGWRDLDVAFEGETLDAKLVMEPFPRDMPNLQMFGALHFSPSGRDLIINFDEPMPQKDFSNRTPMPIKERYRREREFRESKETRQQRRFRQDVTDPQQWPANGVVLLADVDEEGLWLPILEAENLPQGDKYFGGIRLLMTNGPELAEGSGFIRYVPDAYRRQTKLYGPLPGQRPLDDLSHLPAFIDADDVETANQVASDQQRVMKPVHGIADDELYREMELAPEKGYQPTMPLSPIESNARMKLGGYGWQLYFYFKTADGRYGKGYFEEMGVGGEMDKPALTMRCVLYINPVPGDRRLDDGRAGWLEKDPERPIDLNLPATRPTTQPTTDTGA